LPDLDTAVTYAINGIFGNMGEVCNAGSRLLLDRPIAKEFLARSSSAARTRTGPATRSIPPPTWVRW